MRSYNNYKTSQLTIFNSFCKAWNANTAFEINCEPHIKSCAKPSSLGGRHMAEILMQHPSNTHPSACKSCRELLTASLSSYTLTQCLSPAAEAAVASTGRKQSINRNSGIPYPSASAISWQTVRMGPETWGEEMLTCVHWSRRILTVLKS